jgi:hypothetical protein
MVETDKSGKERDTYRQGLFNPILLLEYFD